MTVIASGALSAGAASVTTSALGGGTHSITATYVPPTTSAFAASSAATPFTDTINQASTTTTAGTPPPTTTVGSSVSLTANVTSTAGIPGGSAWRSPTARPNLYQSAARERAWQRSARQRYGDARYDAARCRLAHDYCVLLEFDQLCGVKRYDGCVHYHARQHDHHAHCGVRRAVRSALDTLTDLLTATVVISGTTAPATTGTVTFSDGATTLGTGSEPKFRAKRRSLRRRRLPTGTHHSDHCELRCDDEFQRIRIFERRPSCNVVGSASTTTALTVAPAPPFLGIV